MASARRPLQGDKAGTATLVVAVGGFIDLVAHDALKRLVLGLWRVEQLGLHGRILRTQAVAFSPVSVIPVLLGDVMPIESLVDVVFYRGMTMQVAVPRDSLGRSNYGMCAVNPSRISKTFDDAALRFVVDHISQQTKWLLEIVNYNVENTQYVTAGDLRALDTLTNVLNFLKVQKIEIDKLLATVSVETVKEHLTEIVDEVSKKSLAKPQPIDLERGFAVIPLKGISVPFHSSYLRSGVKPFQRFLVKKIPKSAVKPANLINKYIPNLTAKPFELTKEYFEEVYKLTNSEKIKNIIDNWESYEKA